MFINSVRIAVEKIGGPTRAANELRVSGVTVFEWIKNQRVPNIDKAKLLSKLSGVAVDDLRPARGFAVF